MRVQKKLVTTTHTLKEIAILKRPTHDLSSKEYVKYIANPASYWRFCNTARLSIERLQVERGYPWDNDNFLPAEVGDRKMMLKLLWNDAQGRTEDDIVGVPDPFTIDLEDVRTKEVTKRRKRQRARKKGRKGKESRENHQDPVKLEYHANVAELTYRRYTTPEEYELEKVRLFFIERVDLQDFVQFVELYARIFQVTRRLHFSIETTANVGGARQCSTSTDRGDSTVNYDCSSTTLSDGESTNSQLSGDFGGNPSEPRRSPHLSHVKVKGSHSAAPRRSSGRREAARLHVLDDEDDDDNYGDLFTARLSCQKLPPRHRAPPDRELRAWLRATSVKLVQRADYNELSV